MEKKNFSVVGIEYDTIGIRAAKISSSISGRDIRYSLENLQEMRGDFTKDAELIDSLKKIKDKIGLGVRDRIVTCVSGKQIFAAQTKFRLLPETEMKSALKFELRKDVPFETASATLDFQILQQPEKTDDLADVLVTIVANTVLQKHLAILGRAGIRPWVVDVLPLAAINSFWAGEYDSVNMTPHVLLHFSPDGCTLVVDGNSVPLYTRSIPFNAEELYGSGSSGITEAERARRVNMLGNELRRSLSFYEKTNGVSNFDVLCLIGDYIYSPELHNGITEKVGLALTGSTLLQKLNVKTNAPLGKFDVAIALAMRRE